MLRQSDIRGFVASYHRNGAHGAGFYACSFRFRQGREFIEMRAAVFDAPGHVAVLSGNLVQRWRGDDFEPLLREAIRLQDEAQPDRAHVHAD